MGNYPVGRLIAEMRGRRKLSQEALAEGICSASTLSKIENGGQMPSRRVYMALLQRLGLSHRSCCIYVSEVEMRRSVLEERIEYLTETGAYQEAYGALAEYAVCGMEKGVGDRETQKLLIACALQMGIRESLLDGEGENLLEAVLLGAVGQRAEERLLPALELQYALCQMGVLREKEGSGNLRALALFKKALGLTVGAVSQEKLAQMQLFTREELRILFHIAVISYGQGEQTEAKRLLFLLRDYMEEKWTDPEERAMWYPGILYQLSVWMGNDGRVDKQMEFCELGIALCLRYDRLALLPQLLSVKGCTLAAAGQRGQAGPVLKQAHLLLQIVGDSAGAETLREKARNLFQMEIMTA
ncbi:MAG: helix-turn-helix domain-containing protein [Blautia sp.]|nr:helix-turn-helix domain-containing protein [Blautia sp.]